MEIKPDGGQLAGRQFVCCSCTNGGDNLCPVVQMEEIKPHGGQLAGRQFVRYSLRDFRGGNSRLRGVEAAGT